MKSGMIAASAIFEDIENIRIFKTTNKTIQDLKITKE